MNINLKIRNNLLFIAIVCLFLGSCEKDTNVYLSRNYKKYTQSTVDLNIVSLYANAKFGKTKGSTIMVEPVCINNDTLAYIINYGDGWELVSGDENYTPILASGSGSYNINNLNHGQKVWLQSELEIIKAVKDSRIAISKEETERNKRFWSRIKGPSNVTKADGDPFEGWELIEILDMGCTEETSGHLIETQWGQQHPWNQCVPYAIGSNSRCVAGCVPVAGAQILKFIHDTLNKPELFYTSGNCVGSVNNFEYTFGDLNSSAWDNMAKVPFENEHKLYQSSLLIGWVGMQIDTEYSLNASSAEMEDLRILFNSMSINCNYSNYDASTVWLQLANNMPVCVSARTSNGDGHAWIIDGYVKQKYEYRYIYKFIDRDSPYNDYGDIKFESEYESYSYILMNWGWNNLVDNTMYSNSLSSSWTQGGYAFAYNKNILYNFN